MKAAITLIIALLLTPLAALHGAVPPAPVPQLHPKKCKYR
jgi:hypothetical protein